MEPLHPNEERFLKQPYEQNHGQLVRFRDWITKRWRKGRVVGVGLIPNTSKNLGFGAMVQPLRGNDIQWVQWDKFECLPE